MSNHAYFPLYLTRSVDSDGTPIETYSFAPPVVSRDKSAHANLPGRSLREELEEDLIGYIATTPDSDMTSGPDGEHKLKVDHRHGVAELYSAGLAYELCKDGPNFDMEWEPGTVWSPDRPV